MRTATNPASRSATCSPRNSASSTRSTEGGLPAYQVRSTRVRGAQASHGVGQMLRQPGGDGRLLAVIEQSHRDDGDADQREREREQQRILEHGVGEIAEIA